MKIEITKNVPQVQIIEAELPYYYRHDLTFESGNSVIYGKIEEKYCTSISINETKNYDKEITYTIEKEYHESIKSSGLANYFAREYKSSKKEYEEALQRCPLFLKDF